MQKFLPITITAIMLQTALAGTSSAETIRQRDYVYSYDDEARSMEEDVFVICTDCQNSKLNEIYTFAARYSVDPGLQNIARVESSKPSESPVSLMEKKEEVATGKLLGTRKLLGIIQFKFDSHALSTKSKEQLDSYNLTNKRIKLEGYTCTIGTDKYNKSLSRNRSKEVAKYLRSKGVSIIDFTGLGKSTKFSEKAMNRRVEIIEGEKE